MPKLANLLFTLSLLAFIPVQVFAQDSNDQGVLAAENLPYQPLPPKEMAHIYAPEFCEFQAGFPEEPMITEKCDGGESGTECYTQASFTHTFGMTATVYTSVICNEIDEDLKNHYDDAVMVKTLELMSQDNVKSQYDTGVSEDEQGRYKMANLVGETQLGISSGIYLAQMWIGERSAMTVEAQLLGDPLEEADGMFRDILRSVQYTGGDNDQNTEDTQASTPAQTPAETLEAE